MIIEGNILKMKSQLKDGLVEYKLPLSEHLIEMNDLISKKIKIEFTGVINDIDTGAKIKKSYGQGYSYQSFISLPQCDMCMMKPELCHFSKGTCRDEGWAKKQCFIPHYVYLSLTSAPKVGITRNHQIPTRWVDQGATKGIILAQVENRLEAGLLEVHLKDFIGDKTNWRKMLQGGTEMDLEEKYNGLIDEVIKYKQGHLKEIIIPEKEEVNIDYPVSQYPEKIKSFNLDKNPCIEDTLRGIKGQYLIFDGGVINLRKYQGYYLKFTFE